MHASVYKSALLRLLLLPQLPYLRPKQLRRICFSTNSNVLAILDN